MQINAANQQHLCTYMMSLRRTWTRSKRIPGARFSGFYTMVINSVCPWDLTFASCDVTQQVGRTTGSWRCFVRPASEGESGPDTQVGTPLGTNGNRHSGLVWKAGTGLFLATDVYVPLAVLKFSCSCKSANSLVYVTWQTAHFKSSTRV